MSSSGEHDDPPAVPDATLGGYLDTHNRPPAFEGPDGHPYTVAAEVEKVADLKAPFVGYLIFPRWADSGLGILSHVESAILARGTSRGTVERQLSELSLDAVREALDQALARKKEKDPDVS